MIEFQDTGDSYSIIISYRDRKDHLELLLPRLKEIFAGKSYEVIISEQDDDDKFQKNSLYNIAVQYTAGNILVFHDVDYYPVENITYYTAADTPFYPVGRVNFLDSENQFLANKDIPGGYRNFHNTLGDHSGGVFVLHRDLFYKTNGFNPYYKGWGKEDDDTRDRLRSLGYSWERNQEGLFYCLYHTHNHPDHDDIDFINNHNLLSQLENNFHLGYKNVSAEVEEFRIDDNIKWLKVKNFTYE